jgi:hypothetical protein
VKPFRNPAGAKERPCPRCKTGRVMTGPQTQYNARSKDGTIVCTDCRLREIIADAAHRTPVVLVEDS